MVWLLGRVVEFTVFRFSAALFVRFIDYRLSVHSELRITIDVTIHAAVGTDIVLRFSAALFVRLIEIR